MALETVIGNLQSGHNQLEPGTFVHADQLTAEQVRNPSLRTHVFYTADGHLYSLEEGVPTLFLTRREHNLVLRHLNDEVDSSYDQLTKTGNYRPDVTEAREAMAAKDTLRIDLTKLRLQGTDEEWRYLKINTTEYDSLNPEERKLAERFYGQGKAFDSAMNKLKDAGIENTRVYVLNPEYVWEQAQDGPVGHASWRDNFGDLADSDADDHGIGIHNALLRGTQEIKPS